MQMTKIQKIISITIVLVVLILGFYYMKNKNNSVENTNTTASTTDNGVVLNNSGANPGYTIEQVPVVSTVNNIPVPDLNRSVTFDKNLVFTEEVKTMVTNKILGFQTELKKNPNNLLVWMDLGMYQKMAGDYEGAKISWKFVSQKAPTDYISLGNLGNLYAYYLKDNAMAENYYRQAISKDPKQIYLYIQLAEVFRDVYKDNDKARAIIEEGLKMNQLDQALLEFKANLK